MSSLSPPPTPTPTGTVRRHDPFIEPMAKIALVVCVLGVVCGLLQLLVVVLLGSSGLQNHIVQQEWYALAPTLLQWLFEHALSITVVLLLASLAGAASAWGLLQRMEWARLLFIAFLLITAALNFVMLWPLDLFFQGLGTVFNTMGSDLSADPEQIQAMTDLQIQLRMQRVISMGMGVATAFAFAGLHGWIAWKLNAPAIRAQFSSRTH